MARNTQPIVKRCRALGISPAVMGYTEKSKTGSTKRNPNGQKRTKKSEYATQLNEKQKVKFIYGILEKQFKMYYEKAAKASGVTGEVLLSTIERRLDNVVYRLGFATTRKEARQLVNHGHYTVNGKKVNIPSYLIKAGDVIAVKEKSKQSPKFAALAEAMSSKGCPAWLEVDKANMSGKVVNLPAREDIDVPITEQLIVELYNR